MYMYDFNSIINCPPPKQLQGEGKIDMSFKVFIVGESGVGKTSMMLRFIDDTFLEDTAPTSGGQPGKKRQIEVDGKSVEIVLFDTDGQERFGNITCSLYQGMHGTPPPKSSFPNGSFAPSHLKSFVITFFKY
jgi:hypothetical protein